MTKIAVLDGYAANPGDISWDALSALGELTVYDRTDDGDVISRIGDADAVFVNKQRITRDTMLACPKLKFIGVLATGYNIVDIEAARELKIAVTNVPAYSTASTAQFAIALLLEACHRIGHHDSAVHSGRWERCADFCFWDYPLVELNGKTLGIVGLGSIGRAVAKTAAALGMRVIAFSRSESAEGREVAEYVDFHTLLRESDVISLHCPLFPETAGMINRDTIALMKDGVIIVNNGRGGLIVEQELAEALDSGKVACAAVDVVSEEPIRGDNPLLHARNCIITPHISWAPREARVRLIEIAANNLRAFLAGTPVNVVSK